MLGKIEQVAPLIKSADEIHTQIKRARIFEWQLNPTLLPPSLVNTLQYNNNLEQYRIA